MLDPRITKLAENLIHYSTELKSGDKVLIEAIDIPHEMTTELIRIAREVGADPVVTLKSNQVQRELLHHACESQIKLIADYEAYRMKKMDAYIGLRGSWNIAELSDVPAEQMKLFQTYWQKPVHMDIRVKDTRWVILRWPHPSMAQSARMSTSAFEKFYFDVCTMDYSRMDKAMQPLVDRMNNADAVRISGPGTDLSFSIKDIPAIGCSGKLNIPDGEVFSAPVKDSVNGILQYNAKTLYQGVIHDDIRLAFKDGKIVEASSSNSEHLNQVLDSDDGSRFIGEFAIGFNPYITDPMLDILFDEKIAGSFHFTPGGCYEGEADNGNHSEVHWDMVCIQTEPYGGGEISFDGEVIRKNGMFVTDDLKPLNPEPLKA